MFRGLGCGARGRLYDASGPNRALGSHNFPKPETAMPMAVALTNGVSELDGMMP